MSKVSSSVSIDLRQPLTQKNINEIEAFKSGLKPNERVSIEGRFSHKIIFIKHKESTTDQVLRQIGNLIAKFKDASKMNNVFIHNKLINLNSKAGKVEKWAPEIKNIHAHVSKKFHASEKISLSSRNFQSLIDPLTKKLANPVFEELKNTEIKNVLKNLDFKFQRNPALSPEVAFMARDSEKLTDVAEEMQSFFNFAKDQANGKPAAYPNRKAVDFAERWMAFESGNKKSFMLHLFGDEKFKAISHAAAALLKFIEAKEVLIK